MPRRNHRKCREQSKTHTRKEKQKNKGNGREENTSTASHILTLIRQENALKRKSGLKRSTIYSSIIDWLGDNGNGEGCRLAENVFDSASEVGQAFHQEHDRAFYEDAVMISVMAFLLWYEKSGHMDIIERLRPKLRKRLKDDSLLELIERKLRARKRNLKEKEGAASIGINPESIRA